MKLYSVLLSAAFVLSLLMLAPAPAEGAVIDTIYCDGGLDLATGPAIAEWSTLNQATDATSNSVVSDGISVGSYWMPNNYRLIQRSVLKFTMPSLTGYTSLTAGTLSLYVDSITGSSGYSITLYVPTNAANQAELTNADYALTNVGAAASDSVAIATVGWKTLTLNSAGLTYLYGKAGASAPLYLMITNDKDGVAPTGLGVGNSFGIRGYAEANEPELDLEGALTGADVVKTWDGGGADNLASTAANWAGNVLPAANNQIVFDGAISTKACTWDLTTAVYSFTIEADYSGVITQASNINIGNGGFDMDGGTFTASRSYTIACSGDFDHDGGTLTNYLVCLDMTGNGKNIDVDNVFLAKLMVSGDTTISTSLKLFGYGDTTLVVDSGKVLTLNANMEFDFYIATNVYSNSGEIASTSFTFSFVLRDQSSTVAFGTINADIRIDLASTAAASRTVNLGVNTVFGGDVYISSSAVSYTMALSHGGNKELEVDGTLYCQARGKAVQGTGAWSFGGVSVSGASSNLTMAGAMTVTGDFVIAVDGSFYSSSTSAALTVWDDFDISTAASIGKNVYLILETGNIVAYETTSSLFNLTVLGHSYIDAGVVVRAQQVFVEDPVYILTVNGELIVSHGAESTATGFFCNLGTIDGAGVLDIALTTEDQAGTGGTVAVNTFVSASSAANANRKFTVDEWYSNKYLTILSSHASYTMNMTVLGTAQASNFHIDVRGILWCNDFLYGAVVIDGGVYHEYVTTGTVTVVSGTYESGWTANQAFSEFVTIVPDWSNVDTVGSLGIRTLVEIVLIVLPAVVLGFILGPIGVVVGLAVMSSIMFFAGSVGLGVFLPTLMATIIYFIRGRQ